MNQHAIPKIDAHTHLFYDRPFLGPLLEAWRMRAAVINITGKTVFAGDMATRWRAMVALKERDPDRYALCTSFDAEGIEEDGFAGRVVAQLREEIAQGAAMVKVWKDIGLDIVDRAGRHVQIDDPRFRPVWDFLAEEGIPVLAHIAEPRAAWRPLDPKSPHYAYYSTHPQYHLYRHPEMPAWEAIIAARDRWVEQNPGLVVIGAHLGSTEHDVDEVAERLERFPNFYVDTAERFGDLITQPSEKVRAFFVKYHDRILYGTDVILDRPAGDVPPDAQERERAGYAELLRTHWEYLSSDRTIEIADRLLEPLRVEGLHLPEAVLRDVYARNARRLIRF